MKDKAPQIPVNEVHAAARSPLIEGEDINMCGLEWRISALSLRQDKALGEALEKAGDDQKKQYNAQIESILWALQRNYPAMTMDHLEDLLDKANYAKVVTAVMGVSGLNLGNVEKPVGEPLT